MRLFRMCVLVGGVAVSPAVLADGQWLLGLGAGVGRSPLLGADDKVEPLPWFSYENGRFSADGESLSWRLFESDQRALSLVLGGRDPGFETSDALDHLERDPALEGGLAWHQALSRAWSFEGAVNGDLIGEHRGYSVDLALSHGVSRGNFDIEVSVGASYVSAELADYLYGVGTDEATAAVPAWQAEAGWLPGLALTLIRPLDERSAVVFSADLQSLADFEQSPVLERRTAHSVSVFWVRQF